MKGTRELRLAGIRAALFLLAGFTFALANAQDFPVLKGNSNRTGASTNPGAGYPGVANLNWFQPTGGFSPTSNFIRQAMSTEVTFSPGTTSGWEGIGLANITDEILNPYFPVKTGDATEDAASGYTAYQAAGTNAIDYYFAYAIPSSTDTTKPTVPLNNTDTLCTAAWKVEPANAANRVPGSYGLYAYLPQGSMIDPQNTSAGSLFTPRFYVFQIKVSNGTVFTDIVDTSVAGAGWVRLGNGGLGTTKTFAYDGTTPIVVTQFNTVPRDNTGALTETSVFSGGKIVISPPKVVIANAVMAVGQGTQTSSGVYLASPIASDFNPASPTGTHHAVAVLNTPLTGSDSTTQMTGTVSSYDLATGTLRWQWSPSQTSAKNFLMTAQTAGVTAGAGWNLSAVSVGSKGTQYYTSSITGTPPGTAVQYAPTMPDGQYQIQMWIPGSGGGFTFPTALQVEIHEGATVTTTTVNENTKAGWVTLGTRLFNHNNTQGDPLTVDVTNYSALGSDLSDTAFADAVQFIGQGNFGISSTPIQTTVPITPSGGGTPVMTAVTIVAAEDGHIYCLDSTGDGHGGTTLYWAYPSLSSVANDPNQAVGFDGPGPTATMPSGFGLSSGFVEQVNGNYNFYIGSTNGRVYCIDTAGRGDTTTTRLWTYPDDYPATPVPSNLGPIVGSIAFDSTNVAKPTVFVPTVQGRLYALDAAGNGSATRTTKVNWAFPSSDESVSALATWTSAAHTPPVPGDAAWTNPGNAAANDTSYASATPDLNNGGSGQTEYLQGVAPTMNIPAGATITGIQVRIVKHRSAGDNGLYIHDAEVRLVRAGNILTAVNRADTTDDWSVNNDQTSFYGGQNDLWGQTGGSAWTAADFGPNFGVAIVATGNGNSGSNAVIPTAFVNYVEVHVFYVAQGTLGSIVSTPVVAFGNVYFGTTVGLNDLGQNLNSGFFAVNENTGTMLPAWQTNNLALQTKKSTYGQFNGSPAYDPLGQGTYTLADDFATGPIAISAAELNTYDASNAQVDSIIVMNENQFLAAIYADGANAGLVESWTDSNSALHYWATNELLSSIKGNLSYTPLQVFDNTQTGSKANAPCVMVPTADGRFDGLFALNGDNGDAPPGTSANPNKSNQAFGKLNSFGTRLAWEWVSAAGAITASMAIGRGIMLGADEGGFLYAFGNGSSTTSSNPPGYGGSPPNESGGSTNTYDFQNAKIDLITQSAYQQLRLGNLTYQQATTSPNKITGTRAAWDWGETMYIMVHDFPGTPVISQAATVTFQFSVAGMSNRSLGVQALQFPSSDSTVPVSPTSGQLLAGYAILPFTLQGNGSTALPPGNASCMISFNVLGGSNRIENVSLTPSTTNNVPFTFGVANPIGLVMEDDNTGTPVNQQSIGYVTSPADPQNLVNGSPAGVTGNSTRFDLLTSDFLDVAHGSSATNTVWLVDRSLMTLLHGPGKGVDGIRVQRADLAWNTSGEVAGQSIVAKQIPEAFSSFEDLPINTPNNSIDYPDIKREQLTFVKDPNGSPENPIYNGVTLFPPTNINTTSSPYPTRTLTQTPLAVTENVLPYQPPNPYQEANSSGVQDSAGNSIISGYRGLVTVFHDTYGQGVLTLDGNQREAYRTFNLATGVSYDERTMSSTPTVDLGSLSQGVGLPNDNPWIGPFTETYKSFNVTNIGNVNDLHQRIAKASGPSGQLNDWAILSNGNDPNAWLDAETNVVSDIDQPHSADIYPNYALTSQVLLQKPRVGDRVGTVLNTNPIRRANPNLGTFTGPLLTSGPPAAPPRISVSVPFGFPVGTYSQLMRVIEDTNENQALDEDSSNNPLETMTDPGFTLTFHVRETRLTGKPSPDVLPLVDNAITGTENLLFANSQPAAMRDSSGNLVVVWPSSRPSFNAPEPASAPTDQPYNLYVASMAGGQPGTGFNQSNVSDLNLFQMGVPNGANPSWFQKGQGPYPTTPPAQLFIDPSLSGYSLNTNSVVRFTSPAFPSSPYNPLTGAANSNPYLVFEGDGQVSNSAGTITNSRIFIAKASIGGNGSVTVADPPTGLPETLTFGKQGVMTGIIKNRPTVVQFGSNATVFYATAGAGQGQIYYATYNGTAWTNNVPLTLPSVFESVGAPSVTARIYNGPGETINSVPVLSHGAGLIELAIPATIRGRPHPDIYYARAQCAVSGANAGAPMPLQGSSDVSNILLDLPKVSGESLVPSGQTGAYSSAGVDWDVTAGVFLTINNTQALSNPQVDPNTGIISANNPVFGGKIYLDPNAGSVRFTGTLPKNAVIQLSYTPRLLRVSSGNAADLYPTVLYDNRYVGDFSYWSSPSGGAAPNTSAITTGRYIFTYGATASGNGQTARPQISTYRFGVQLGQAIGTNSDGTVKGITVSGNSSYYQVDPGNGRVYFTDADEDNASVSVTYDDVDGNQHTEIHPVSILSEAAEQPIAIEGAVNEAQLTAFLDPFGYTPPPYTSSNPARPGLIWLFWTSTRGGAPDVFFESIAPKMTPIAGSK